MPSNEQRRQAAKRKLERQLARRAERAQRRRRVAVISTVIAVLVIVAIVVVLTTVEFGGDEQPPPPTPSAAGQAPGAAADTVTPPRRAQPLPGTVDCNYPVGGPPTAKPVEPPPAQPVSTEGTVPAQLETTAGPIGLTLHRDLAPCTVNSFIHLAEQGFYNDTPCHRLTTSPTLQVLQCGDPTGTGSGGPGYTVPDELFPELRYERGYLAMANIGQPNTGGSQFFIVYGNSELDPAYTVFATLTPEGLQTVDRVAQAGSDGSLDPEPGGGRPNLPVQVTAATIGT